MTERIDKLTPNLFLDGPAEFLAKTVAQQFAAVTQWATLFGENIDGYQRFDYSERSLPALRIYNVDSIREHQSWFITGDLVLDVIYPASIRRGDLQEIPDRVAAAMQQQFRRSGFFDAVEQEVPGLNELGKRVSVDKGLGFTFGREGDEPVPLTQFRANFKVDLREWDDYLESESRTVDEPYEKSLGELTRIASLIRGLEDDGTTGVDVNIDQRI